MSEQNLVSSKSEVHVVDSAVTQMYDAASGEFFPVELPQKEVQVTRLYDWRDTEQVFHELLAIPGVEIVSQQFADAKKTSKSLLNSQRIFQNLGFEDMVEWDHAWLQNRGASKPEVNQIQVVAEAIISAKPEIKNRIALGLMRMWCANGATKAVWRKDIELMSGNRITVERPDGSEIQSPVALLESGVQSLPDMKVIEAEILSDEILPASQIESRVGRLREMLQAHYITAGWGADRPEPPANRWVRSHFAIIEAMPDWFNRSLDNQLALMIENQNSFKGQGRGLVTADIDTAITNGINWHREGSKQRNNFYIERRAHAAVEALSSWLAMN